MQKAEFVVGLEEGLHMRPAALLSRAAMRFRSSVTLQMRGARYNGKSALELLGMCALKGSEVQLMTDGEDEQAAFDTLTALLADLGVYKK